MADVEPAGADAAAKVATAAAAAAESAAADAKSTQLQQLPADTGAADTAAAEASASGGGAGGEAAAASADVPHLTFKVQYGKQSQELKRPATSTIADLKAEVERALAIPPARQKLMFRGLLKNDSDTLEQVGIKNGAKVLLIGSSQADIAAAKPADAGGKDLAWDAPKVQEDVTKQPQHAKVIAKGVPEDAMPGLADKQVPLPDSLLAFNNLLNSQGNKVRLTFKPDIQQLWIASATNTQKIPYSTITKIEAWPIAEAAGYSVLALHLGVGGASRCWLYFCPSQYVSGIKIRLLGVQALL